MEFELVHGKPHQEAREIYARTDIVVDQILAGTCGAFAVETMVMGKPVTGYIREVLWNSYPTDLPIISSNPNDIYGQLEILIFAVNWSCWEGSMQKSIRTP